MKKALFVFIGILLSFSLVLSVFAKEAIKSGAEPEDGYIVESDTTPEIDVPSAILIEKVTGTVLFEKNADEALAPASVTKTMTLLLVAEALTDGRISIEDSVCISAYAASMGGSQVFLKEGELFTVEELIKCTVIASANDAAVALAEHTYGSESAFVDAMNSRASELGLTATHFENVTGLDDDVTNHTMSARDIAKISRELLQHECITKYSSVWQDSIRNGEFVLTNTNRLVRYYEGCTGLKTGSTDKAGFCVSASAKRKGTELIAVIMGAESGSARNEAARTLLDYGFANYTLYRSEEETAGEIKVKGCTKGVLPITKDAFTAVIKKSDASRVIKTVELPESIAAPMVAGEVIGRVIYIIDGEPIGASEIRLLTDAERISFGELFLKIITFGFCK